MKDKIEKWSREYIELNRNLAPSLIGANIALGIFGLFMGFWGQGLFNFVFAYATYFLTYKLNNEN